MNEKKMSRMSPLPALASLLMISSAIVSCSKTSNTPIASDATLEQLVAVRAHQDKDNFAMEKLSATDVYKLSGMDFKYVNNQPPARMVTTTVPYTLISAGNLDAASDKKANDALTEKSYTGDLRGSKMDIDLKFAIPTSGKLKEAPVEADLKAVLYEIKANAGDLLPKAQVTTSAIAQDVAASVHVFNVFDPKLAHKTPNGHQYFLKKDGEREVGAYMKHIDDTHVDIVFLMREKANGKSWAELIVHAVKDAPAPAAPAPAPAAPPTAPIVAAPAVVPEPSKTPAPTATPSPAASGTPAPTATATPMEKATPAGSATPSATPTASASPAASASPSVEAALDFSVSTDVSHPNN